MIGHKDGEILLGDIVLAREAGTGQRWKPVLGMGAMYLLFIGAWAWQFQAWWPLLALAQYLTATGDAELRQPGSVIKSETLHYHQPTDTVTATGKVYIKHGRRAQLELATVGAAVTLTVEAAADETEIDSNCLIDIRNDVANINELLLNQDGNMAARILGFEASDCRSGLEHVP